MGFLLVACTATGNGLGVMDVPSIGETRPETLNDGQPVFIVHDLDGSVFVLEAESTHRSEEPVAWCPSSRSIDGLYFGSKWDPQGRYLAGPAPRDLGSYDFRPEGNRIVILSYTAPTSRSTTSSGFAGPSCAADPGSYEVHPYFESE